MNSKVTKVDNTKRTITVEVSGDIVKNKFSDVYKQLAKDAKVPGFRPGTAPRDILEKRYADVARDQVIKDLIPEVYNQAIQKENLDVIELPQISDVKLDNLTLSFVATVEVSPEIKLKEYKGLPLEFKTVSVEADEIKRSIDSLKESRAVSEVDDACVRGLGYPSLQEFQKALEYQLFLQKENAQRQAIENQVIDELLKSLDFKVPQSLIDRHLQEMLRQTKIDLAMRGMPREKIDEQDAAMREELAPQAQKQVKVYLVLSHIAKKENIPVDDAMPRKVVELLLRNASWKIQPAKA